MSDCPRFCLNYPPFNSHLFCVVLSHHLIPVKISCRIQRRIVINQLKSLHKLLDLLSEALIYTTDFSKSSKYLISQKSNKGESMCSIVTDGQREGQMWQINSRFLQLHEDARKVKIMFSMQYAYTALYCIQLLGLAISSFW